jgi:uncharacterized coiled-coil protein SlyX
MKKITNITYPAFALFAIACFALAPQARAVCQDACLANANTVQGDDALISLTTGTNNTADGFQALHRNTTGPSNTAVGSAALLSNTTGSANTAVGNAALPNNTTGQSNVATGYNALAMNTTGIGNVAVGNFALWNNTGGGNNIALGSSAGYNLTSGHDNIDIGNVGIAGESHTMRLGTQGTQRKAFIAGITATAVSGKAVVISSTGQLGVAPSSVRFKEEIKQMDRASEAILALQPVTFRYKHDLDPDGIPQFGLVAEEVEKVNPELVVRDEQGKPYMVRYEAVNAMLLNEFLKEHRKVEEQEHKLAVQDSKSREQNATITELKSTLAQQQRQIGLLTSQMQRVSDQLTANEIAPAMVVKNR